MPPKKEKKMSKKQRLKLERERQEELARQQQEEEMARQEALRKQREAQEARKQEEKRLRREAELARLEQEANEDSVKNADREKQLKGLVKEKWEEADWKAHLVCSEVENPRDPCKMNSFLSMWRNPNLGSQADVQGKMELNDTLMKCDHAAKLANGLQKVIVDSSIDVIQPIPLEELMNFYFQIGEITEEKLDLLTLDLLGRQEFQNVLNPECVDSEFAISFKTSSVEFGLWITNCENIFKDKKVEFKECNVTISIPKKLGMTAQKPHGCRYYWTQEDYLTPQNSEMKTIGGVMHIEILEVPDILVRLPNSPWQVSEVLTEIVKMDYGLKLDAGPEVDDKVDVVRTLPPQFFLGPPEYELRWWNQSEDKWTMDSDGKLTINRETRQLHFTSARLFPLALCYPSNIYVDIDSWNIEPAGVERCVITLESERFGIKIEVVGSDVKLLPVGPPIDQLAHIYSTLHTPSTLIQELRNAGVNLWRSSIKQTKDMEVEKKAYEQISTIASCFQISFSRWNQTVEGNACLFQLRKPLTMDEKQNLDEHGKSGWKLMLVDFEKCVLLKSTEHSETVDLETPDDENMQHESHISVRRCTDPLSTSDIVRSLTHTSLRFQDTMRALLSLVQPLQLVVESKDG